MELYFQTNVSQTFFKQVLIRIILLEQVTNGEIFEVDMSLRTEKEKQRSALIKLREISSIDPG